MRSWEEAKEHYRLTSIEGWMEEDELEWLYKTASLMAGKTVVEVGSFMGRSTCAILAGQKEGGGGRLFSVDSFEGRATPREAEARERGSGWLYGQFMENIKTRSLPMPEVLPMDSTEASLRFLQGTIDWVFIDADHSYESVTRDLCAWVPCVRQGGIASGHDYHPDWASVVSAVDTFFSPFKAGRYGRAIWALRKAGWITGI